MANKTEEQKPQQAPQGEMVKIPHEYLIEGVKQAVQEIEQKMAAARLKYLNRYNEKNDNEEFGRRFGYSDHEKIWTEFDRVWNRQSTQPAVIRKVLRVIGDSARYYAIARLRQEMKQEKK
jgi:hypothetical protein